MALSVNEKLTEAFSLALEDRSPGLQDLVSNSNALLYEMKRNGQFQKFSGPTIRERLLYAESGSYTRYSGYGYLNPSPKELVNDAEFEPKMAAVSITLSSEDILKNSGTNQLKDILKTHIMGAEQELEDRFTEDLHSDGTSDGGQQIGGLQLAIPTTVNSGTYGGISRADNAIWRTSSFDIDSDFPSIGTQLSDTTVYPIFRKVVEQRSRGKRGPNMILCAESHYGAFSDATMAIQRINDENGLGKLGFTSLKFYGVGKSIDVVLEGGIGSAMPDDVSYFIDKSALKFRYHPQRNFEKIGGKQMPINQDAIVQHVGFMGNLTMVNPLHMAKLYDSDTAS